MASPDIPWRRPGETPYEGPPPVMPVPQDWEVPVTQTMAPPRRLPEIDHDALDKAENDAMNVTCAVGLAALGLLLIITVLRSV